MDLKTLLGGPW